MLLKSGSCVAVILWCIVIEVIATNHEPFPNHMERSNKATILKRRNTQTLNNPNKFQEQNHHSAFSRQTLREFANNVPSAILAPIDVFAHKLALRRTKRQKADINSKLSYRRKRKHEREVNEAKYYLRSKYVGHNTQASDPLGTTWRKTQRKRGFNNRVRQIWLPLAPAPSLGHEDTVEHLRDRSEESNQVSSSPSEKFVSEPLTINMDENVFGGRPQSRDTTATMGEDKTENGKRHDTSINSHPNQMNPTTSQLQPHDQSATKQSHVESSCDLNHAEQHQEAAKMLVDEKKASTQPTSAEVANNNVVKDDAIFKRISKSVPSEFYSPPVPSADAAPSDYGYVQPPGNKGFGVYSEKSGTFIPLIPYQAEQAETFNDGRFGREFVPQLQNMANMKQTSRYPGEIRQIRENPQVVEARIVINPSNVPPVTSDSNIQVSPDNPDNPTIRSADQPVVADKREDRLAYVNAYPQLSPTTYQLAPGQEQNNYNNVNPNKVALVNALKELFGGSNEALNLQIPDSLAKELINLIQAHVMPAQQQFAANQPYCRQINVNQAQAAEQNNNAAPVYSYQLTRPQVAPELTANNGEQYMYSNIIASQVPANPVQTRCVLVPGCDCNCPSCQRSQCQCCTIQGCKQQAPSPSCPTAACNQQAPCQSYVGNQPSASCRNAPRFEQNPRQFLVQQSPPSQCSYCVNTPRQQPPPCCRDANLKPVLVYCQSPACNHQPKPQLYGPQNYGQEPQFSSFIVAAHPQQDQDHHTTVVRSTQEHAPLQMNDAMSKSNQQLFPTLAPGNAAKKNKKRVTKQCSKCAPCPLQIILSALLQNKTGQAAYHQESCCQQCVKNNWTNHYASCCRQPTLERILNNQPLPTLTLCPFCKQQCASPCRKQKFKLVPCPCRPGMTSNNTSQCPKCSSNATPSKSRIKPRTAKRWVKETKFSKPCRQPTTSVYGVTTDKNGRFKRSINSEQRFEHPKYMRTLINDKRHSLLEVRNAQVNDDKSSTIARVKSSNKLNLMQSGSLPQKIFRRRMLSGIPGPFDCTQQKRTERQRLTSEQINLRMKGISFLNKEKMKRVAVISGAPKLASNRDTQTTFQAVPGYQVQSYKKPVPMQRNLLTNRFQPKRRLEIVNKIQQSLRDNCTQRSTIHRKARQMIGKNGEAPVPIELKLTINFPKSTAMNLTSNTPLASVANSQRAASQQGQIPAAQATYPCAQVIGPPQGAPAFNPQNMIPLTTQTSSAVVARSQPPAAAFPLPTSAVPQPGTGVPGQQALGADPTASSNYIAVNLKSPKEEAYPRIDQIPGAPISAKECLGPVQQLIDNLSKEPPVGGPALDTFDYLPALNELKRFQNSISESRNVNPPAKQWKRDKTKLLDQHDNNVQGDQIPHKTFVGYYDHVPKMNIVETSVPTMKRTSAGVVPDKKKGHTLWEKFRMRDLLRNSKHCQKTRNNDASVNKLFEPLLRRCKPSRYIQNDRPPTHFANLDQQGNTDSNYQLNSATNQDPNTPSVTSDVIQFGNLLAQRDLHSGQDPTKNDKELYLIRNRRGPSSVRRDIGSRQFTGQLSSRVGRQPGDRGRRRINRPYRASNCGEPNKDRKERHTAQRRTIYSDTPLFQPDYFPPCQSGTCGSGYQSNYALPTYPIDTNIPSLNSDSNNSPSYYLPNNNPVLFNKRQNLYGSSFLNENNYHTPINYFVPSNNDYSPEFENVNDPEPDDQCKSSKLRKFCKLFKFRSRQANKSKKDKCLACRLKGSTASRGNYGKLSQTQPFSFMENKPVDLSNMHFETIEPIVQPEYRSPLAGSTSDPFSLGGQDDFVFNPDNFDPSFPIGYDPNMPNPNMPNNPSAGLYGQQPPDWHVPTQNKPSDALSQLLRQEYNQYDNQYMPVTPAPRNWANGLTRNFNDDDALNFCVPEKRTPAFGAKGSMLQALNNALEDSPTLRLQQSAKSHSIFDVATIKPSLIFNKAPVNTRFFEKTQDNTHFFRKAPDNTHFFQKTPDNMNFLDKTPNNMHFLDKPHDNMHFFDKRPDNMHFFDKPPDNTHFFLDKPPHNAHFFFDKQSHKPNFYLEAPNEHDNNVNPVAKSIHMTKTPEYPQITHTCAHSEPNAIATNATNAATATTVPIKSCATQTEPDESPKKNHTCDAEPAEVTTCSSESTTQTTSNPAPEEVDIMLPHDENNERYESTDSYKKLSPETGVAPPRDPARSSANVPLASLAEHKDRTKSIKAEDFEGSPSAIYIEEGSRLASPLQNVPHDVSSLSDELAAHEGALMAAPCGGDSGDRPVIMAKEEVTTDPSNVIHLESGYCATPATNADFLFSATPETARKGNLEPSLDRAVEPSYMHARFASRFQSAASKASSMFQNVKRGLLGSHHAIESLAGEQSQGSSCTSLPPCNPQESASTSPSKKVTKVVLLSNRLDYDEPPTDTTPWPDLPSTTHNNTFPSNKCKGVPKRSMPDDYVDYYESDESEGNPIDKSAVKRGTEQRHSSGYATKNQYSTRNVGKFPKTPEQGNTNKDGVVVVDEMYVDRDDGQNIINKREDTVNSYEYDTYCEGVDPEPAGKIADKTSKPVAHSRELQSENHGTATLDENLENVFHSLVSAMKPPTTEQRLNFPAAPTSQITGVKKFVQNVAAVDDPVDVSKMMLQQQNPTPPHQTRLGGRSNFSTLHSLSDISKLGTTSYHSPLNAVRPTNGYSFHPNRKANYDTIYPRSNVETRKTKYAAPRLGSSPGRSSLDVEESDTDTDVSPPVSPPAVPPYARGASSNDTCPAESCDPADPACICSLDAVVHDFAMLAAEHPTQFLAHVQQYNCTKFVKKLDNFMLTNEQKPRAARSVFLQRQARVVRSCNQTAEQIKFHTDFVSTDSHTYALPGSTVEIPCLSMDQLLKIESTILSFKWTNANGIKLKDHFHESPDGKLTIEHVRVEDEGNYTCLVTYDNCATNEETVVSFPHELSVVGLPKYFASARVDYRMTSQCDAEDVEVWNMLMPNLMKHWFCGNDGRADCTVDVASPQCFNEAHGNMLVSLGVHIADVFSLLPPINETVCNVSCRTGVESKFVHLLYDNLVKVINTPVLCRLSYRNVDYTPMVDSIRVTLMQGCEAGMHLIGERCFPCPADMYSADESAVCSWCEPGTYQPQHGAGACIRCPHIFAARSCLMAPIDNMDLLDPSNNPTTFLVYLLIMIITIAATLIICCCVRCCYKRRKKKKVSWKNSDEVKSAGDDISESTYYLDSYMTADEIDEREYFRRLDSVEVLLAKPPVFGHEKDTSQVLDGPPMVPPRGILTKNKRRKFSKRSTTGPVPPYPDYDP